MDGEGEFDGGEFLGDERAEVLRVLADAVGGVAAAADDRVLELVEALG